MGYAKTDNEDMKEHILKDNILKYLADKENQGKQNSAQQIADKFNVSVDHVLWCIDDLVAFDYVGKDSKGTVTVQTVGIRSIHWITHRGRFFLNQSGGYTKSHKMFTINKRYTQAKTIMAILNAIAIIYIGYWGVKVADKSNKLEKIEMDFKKQAARADSLQTLLNQTTNHVHGLDTTVARQRIP